jgi:hypothetical protein
LPPALPLSSPGTCATSGKRAEEIGLRREPPDAFLADLYDKIPELTVSSLANARRNLSRTRVSALEFIQILDNQKLVRLARRLQKHLTDL